MWKIVTKLLFVQGFISTSIGLYFVTQAQPVKMVESTVYDGKREVLDSGVTTREGTLIGIGLLLMAPMLVESIYIGSVTFGLKAVKDAA